MDGNLSTRVWPPTVIKIACATRKKTACVRVSSDMAAYPEDIETERREEPSNAAPQQNNTSDPRRRGSPHITESGDSDENLQVSHGKKSYPKLRLVVRIAIGLLLFVIVLASVTFSKLTLIRLTDNLIANTNHTSKEVRLRFPL